MRKIVIPQEAIKRHEETLGEALLGHLKRLANGWAPNVSKSKDCKDKTANALPLCCQSFSYSVPPCVTHYWRWVYKQFCDKHILTASPVVLLRFAKENLAELGRAGWFCGKGEELQGNITIIIESLFNYDALRAGKVLKKLIKLQRFLGRKTRQRSRTGMDGLSRSLFACWMFVIVHTVMPKRWVLSIPKSFRQKSRSRQLTIS